MMLNLNLNQANGKARRSIDLVGAAMCLLMTGLLYGVAVHPLVEQRREQRATQQQVLAERSDRATTAASLMEARQAYRAVQRAVADNALRLEPLPALNRRLAELTAMAREAGLAVEGVRPGAPSASEHYRTVPVQVTGRGSFHATSRFLRELHHELPDVGVWSLQLDRRGDSSAAAPQFQLDLVWYAAPPGE